jgi:hypothetical protein
MRCVAVPNALTAPLARPEVDLVVGSLDERPLARLLAALGDCGEPASAPRRG